jgi:hypothetical protein
MFKINILMPKFHIEINNAVDFNIDLYDTKVAELFYNAHRDLKNNHPDWAAASLQDYNRFNITYFKELIADAQQQNIVDWAHYTILPGAENYAANQVIFNQMHRDVEVKAGINKYEGLEDHQRLLVDELHWCLHSLESEDAQLDYQFKPRDIVQLTYRGELQRPEMPKDTVFSRVLYPGEIMLDFPYVGKEPLYCMMHNDNDMLEQACKIIEHISFSWKLNLSRKPSTQWAGGTWPKDIDAALTSWYMQHKEQLDNMGYSVELMLARSGFCPVGIIDDISKLEYIRTSPVIKLTNYELIG